MGDIGMPELIVILVIAMVLFGGGKLPEVGRSLGSAMREFKNAMRDVTSVAEVKKNGKTDSKEEVDKRQV